MVMLIVQQLLWLINGHVNCCCVRTVKVLRLRGNHLWRLDRAEHLASRNETYGDSILGWANYLTTKVLTFTTDEDFLNHC